MRYCHSGAVECSSPSSYYRRDISSRFSRNSLENLEKMFLRYYMHSDIYSIQRHDSVLPVLTVL